MTRVGIIGNGQLAAMLVEAAQSLKLHTVIFSSTASEVANSLASETVLGKLDSEECLSTFFEKCDCVLFENEFVNCDALERAAANSQVRFYPSVSAIRQLQNKFTQKQIMARLGVATSNFLAMKETETLPEFLHRAQEKLGTKFVLKWAQYGYDGGGVRIVETSRLALEDVQLFFQRALDKGTFLFAEGFVKFKRELALVCVREQNQNSAYYPLVVTEQRDGICARVEGPATQLGVDKSLENDAIVAASSLGKELRLIGTFAIEFFETEDGRLLANEIAPRVHNSGHFTQDSCEGSQFFNHLCACLSLHLESTSPNSKFFGMLNILGEDLPLSPRPLQSIPNSKHGEMHWYRKSEIRKGRKLGHINVTADTPEDLQQKLHLCRQDVESWLQSLRNSK